MSRRRSRKNAPAGPATILVVEDDEPIRLALRELLESEGYEVVLAEDGQQAIDLLPSTSPALVVTDVQMPRVDGLQLCDRLRRDDELRDIPIVVLTAARKLEQIQSRANAVVRKPFDIDVLLAVIAQFIRPTVPPRPSTVLQTGRHHAAREAAHRLVLYVTEGSAASDRAQRTLRSVLDVDIHPDVRPTLEIIDVNKDVDRASREGVAMTPTLVRDSGEVREIFVGDLSDLKVLRAFLMRLD